MNNLINIQNKNGQLLVSSRDVANDFNKTHDNVIKAIENYIKTLKNTDSLEMRTLFIESQYTTRGANGVYYKEYLLDRDGFTLLAMGFTGSKALEWKLKYIEAFNKMEEALKEQNSNLKIDSKFMYQLAEQLEEQEKQIAIMKPKAIFADAVSASDTSILVRELSILLQQNGVKIGQNRLFDWLRSNGFLIKRKGTDYNMPTQKSMELGLFEIKETSIARSNGQISISKTSKVTGKGQIYFINKFKEMGLEKVV